MVPPLLALFAWPLVSVAFFRKLRLPLAILVTIVGGFLFLPENTSLNLPGVPALDKRSVPALTALVLALVFADRSVSEVRPDGLMPRHPALRLLVAVLLGGAVLTALTNSDPLTYGFRRLPAITLYDAASMTAGALLMLLPLILARRFLASPETHRLLLLVLCVAALGYSLLALFEVRMSPQLNRWVYGFFPHSWAQHVRGGGFRPVVFLQHGLVLGIFLCMALLATVALSRIDARRRGVFLLGAFWLLGTLVLSRTLGALFIATALVPVIMVLGVRGQLLAAAVIGSLILAYPVARGADVLPIDRVLQLAEGIDPQRAASFATRLENEERMLAKATERPFFGWGGWGRWRVYDDAGGDITISDGAWIITLGVRGWVGYIGLYGLLTLPILLLFAHRRKYGVGMESSALAVILAANLVDLVPNSSNTPLTWLLAGALWGRLEWQAAESRPKVVAETSGGDGAGYRPPTALNEPAERALMQSQIRYTRQTKRIERAKAGTKSTST